MGNWLWAPDCEQSNPWSTSLKPTARGRNIAVYVSHQKRALISFRAGVKMQLNFQNFRLAQKKLYL